MFFNQIWKDVRKFDVSMSSLKQLKVTSKMRNHQNLDLIVGGQTLGSVTTFLGRNHMNLFGKFNVSRVIFARAVRC